MVWNSSTTRVTRRRAAGSSAACSATTSPTRLSRATPAVRVGPADGLVPLVQRQQSEAEGVLHPRPPEAVELAPEDREHIGDRLVAIAPQADVEQVQPEGARAPGQVEEDDSLSPAG